MSDVQLYDIARSCGGRISGALRDLGLIAPQDVTSLAPLTFKPSKRMYLYEENRFSGRLIWKSDDGNRAGDVIDYTLTAFVAGIRLEMDLLAKGLLNRRIHVLATYWSGEQVLLRNMRLLHSHDSAERITGKIGYSLVGKLRTSGGAGLLGSTLNLPVITTGGDTGESTDIMEKTSLTTTASTYTYSLPSGKMLDLIKIQSNSAQTISIQNGLSGDFLLEEVHVGASQYAPVASNELYAVTTTPLVFTGLVGTNSIVIWTK